MLWQIVENCYEKAEKKAPHPNPQALYKETRPLKLSSLLSICFHVIVRTMIISKLLGIKSFIYFFQPGDFEENEPWSSTHDPPSANPVLPPDPVLETSIPDSRQESNEDFTLTQSNTGRTENFVKNDNRQPTNTVPMGDVRRDIFEGSDNCDDLKESEHKSVSELVSNSPKVKEKLSNIEESIILVTDEEDVCPICLEGKHSFHFVHI